MNAAETKRAVKLYARGLSLRAVGAKIGWGHEAVRQALIGAGAEIRTANHTLPSKAKRDREILAAITAGVSYDLLAAKHAITKQRVGQIYKEAETRRQV